MKLLNLLILLFCFSINAQADIQGAWHIEVYRQVQKSLTKVAELTYEASVDDTGAFTEYTSSVIPLRTKTQDGTILHGRINFYMHELTETRSQLVMQIWDSSGLKESSSFYKSHLKMKVKIGVLEEEEIAFTQGNASIENKFARFIVRIKGLSTKKTGGVVPPVPVIHNID